MPSRSLRKRVVEKYLEGFRNADHEAILDCLTEDVIWEMHPWFALSGRDEVKQEIESAATSERPSIEVTRLVEEGDVVVAEGSVQVGLKTGGRIDALFCDVFQFRGDRICRLMTYQVDRLTPG
jgi:uncharacterized protein